MNPILSEGILRGSLEAQIVSIGRDLRTTITAVLEAVAGAHPRPTRVTRAIGLDKSLASRLVRAVQASSDLDLMHLVPSPGGLLIFADLAARYADPVSIENLRTATQRFEDLLDAVPGGRASIDAQISESSQVALAKREHIAKQASFKSMSFLLGHFCDVLTTTLFLVPSPDGRHVDGIEIHRRIGLRRMRPSIPLALLGVWSDPGDPTNGDAVRFETLDGEDGSKDPKTFLLPAFCSQPMPELDVVRDGAMTTLVLAGDPSVHAPAHLTSSFFSRNGWTLTPEGKIHFLRGYVLHTPARQVVRDVYIAESLYPDAIPQVSFVLPGPRTSMRPPGQGGERHFSEVELTSSIEQLPYGPQAYNIPEVVNHSAVVRHVLERAGHGLTRFRGWRCSVVYPVPLIEMIWWLSHPSFVEPGAEGTRGG